MKSLTFWWRSGAYKKARYLGKGLGRDLEEEETRAVMLAHRVRGVRTIPMKFTTLVRVESHNSRISLLF